MAETRTGPEGEASEPGQHNFASFDDNDTSEQHRRDLTAPVCALAREHLGLDDEQLIQLVLAAPVSSQDDARYDPLWPMIVGP